MKTTTVRVTRPVTFEFAVPMMPFEESGVAERRAEIAFRETVENGLAEYQKQGGEARLVGYGDTQVETD